jgi:hypothetical protein
MFEWQAPAEGEERGGMDRTRFPDAVIALAESGGHLASRRAHAAYAPAARMRRLPRRHEDH